MTRDLTDVAIRIDPFPDTADFKTLWQAAWQAPWEGDLAAILERSLAHVGAYHGGRLVGFVNLAWDGGSHAFLLDTTVHQDMQRLGLGTRLVNTATKTARDRGAQWLHVDCEPHLNGFYQACGFRPTEAGLIDLRSA